MSCLTTNGQSVTQWPWPYRGRDQRGLDRSRFTVLQGLLWHPSGDGLEGTLAGRRSLRHDIEQQQGLPIRTREFRRVLRQRAGAGASPGTETLHHSQATAARVARPSVEWPWHCARAAMVLECGSPADIEVWKTPLADRSTVMAVFIEATR